MKPIRITKEQLYKMNRKAGRDIEIEEGKRVNHKKVHKSKKTYTRKGKQDWE